jgi:phospholipase C
VDCACSARDFTPKATLRLAVLLAVGLSFWGCSGPQSAGIEHTVIILQENHTFDNYFGTFSGAGPSFPNHLFTVAAQSGGVIDNVSAGSDDLPPCHRQRQP